MIRLRSGADDRKMRESIHTRYSLAAVRVVCQKRAYGDALAARQ